MSEEIKIRIKNFEKYNPRNDVKNASWIRFENGFFEHSVFFDFSIEERIAWVYILCYASKSDNRELHVSYAHFSRVTNADGKVLFRTIQKLKSKQLIEVLTLRGRYASDTHPCATERNETERNETERNETERNEEKLSTVSCAVVISEKSQQEFLPVVSKDTPVTAPKPMDFISKINPDIFRRWERLYQDPDFLNTELLKALNWYESNPRKLPKSSGAWARALSNWFAKGWEWRAKSIKGTKPPVKVDIGEILKGFENDDSKRI